MSDITATTVTADGTAVNHPARVKSIYYIRTSNAGSLVLRWRCKRNNTTYFDCSSYEAGEDESNTLNIPSDGIRFSTDVYVDVTNVSSVTLFHA